MPRPLSVRPDRATSARQRRRHRGGAPARALCWRCACLRSLRFRRAALSMPHRVHRQPKRDEFGVVAVNPVVFWGASAPSGARCSPCAPARATWPRALQRLCGRTGPTRKLVCPFPDPNPRLRHRLLTLAHALARLTNPAPPQISRGQEPCTGTRAVTVVRVTSLSREVHDRVTHEYAHRGCTGVPARHILLDVPLHTRS